MISSLRLISAVACLCAAAATATGPVVDLTENSANGAGLGFSFKDSDTMQMSKKYVSVQLPKCTIAPLDAVYFYIYGCEFPASFVSDMAAGL